MKKVNHYQILHNPGNIFNFNENKYIYRTEDKKMFSDLINEKNEFFFRLLFLLNHKKREITSYEKN
jgi:hypothetical protein